MPNSPHLATPISPIIPTNGRNSFPGPEQIRRTLPVSKFEWMNVTRLAIHNKFSPMWISLRDEEFAITGD